jgi:hypothetical protein
MLPAPTSLGVIMKKTLISSILLSNLSLFSATSDLEVCNALHDFAAHYTRPFTAIQISGNKNYLSKVAQTFPSSVCILLSKQLHIYEELMRKRPENTILLNCKDDVYHVQRLGECEHFDMIFCPLSAQDCTSDIQTYLCALMRLGDNLILELHNDCDNIKQCIKKYGGREYASTSLSSFYHIEGCKTGLTRKTWVRALESTIFIQSNFNEKKLIKKTPYNAPVITSDWLPGINLITFKMCQGIYPDKATAKNALRAIKYVWHNDWAMHNIIVQGTKFALIDYNDPRMQGREQAHSQVRKKTYKLIVQCLDLDDPQEIEKFYWKYLKTRPTKRIKIFFKKLFHRV